MKRIYEEIQTIELNEFRWQEQVSVDSQAEASQFISLGYVNVSSSPQNVIYFACLVWFLMLISPHKTSLFCQVCSNLYLQVDVTMQLFKQASHVASLGEGCYAKKAIWLNTGSALPSPINTLYGTVQTYNKKV